MVTINENFGLHEPKTRNIIINLYFLRIFTKRMKIDNHNT